MNTKFTILSLFMLMTLHLTTTCSQQSTMHKQEKSTGFFKIIFGKSGISKAETDMIISYMAEPKPYFFVFYTIDKTNKKTTSNCELWIGLTKYAQNLPDDSNEFLKTIYESSSQQNQVLPIDSIYTKLLENIKSYLESIKKQMHDKKGIS